MDDVPDSYTLKNASVLTTVEPDYGPDQQGYRKMARDSICVEAKDTIAKTRPQKVDDLVIVLDTMTLS